ncbi:GNAT family N-acetyltransferase [Xanthomonas albilineans]|uniref:Putative acetyltransferase protein n=1 Tax=Xanthomonas albilineans (strain GPE PC73 / CFBP 7063) TaxID=380358 RepID=D2UG07_XANAP|nr:GNAT family N-acetyltransferase [Xanthomonas albilineans]PPU94251.1 N-acetyltransferase [Xanthomonas albilineans]QHQ29570.1 putative acetyltransferase protein [Xanthomonas albilineans]CBA17318.1 putative acetyltransferase protein [Xanthomonas albilineans GPE PC73]
MRIVCLAEAAQHIPALAQEHMQAFGTLLGDWSLAETEADLRSHRCDTRIPTSWIALDGQTWLGSVSLLQNEVACVRPFSPWLASLYVRPQARGSGVGAALLTHGMQAAARFSVQWLYLYCELPLVEFYRRLGWQRHADLPLGLLQVVVMRIDAGACAA